jgi:deoxycytidine triphosphate deaminase
MIRTKVIVGLEDRAERSVTTEEMYKLLEERGVRPNSIDVRQMNRFRQEKYPLQNGKKKKHKNRIEE